MEKVSLKGRRNQYEDELLERLRECVPEPVHVTITADRGFGDQKRYEQIRTLGFHYVIRFRQDILLTTEFGEQKPAIEWLHASGRARMLAIPSNNAEKFAEKRLLPHEPLEAALYLHRRSLFDKVQLVYYDTTSTYFECDEPGDEPELYGLRQKGYSRDLRPDRRQIVIGLAVDQNGLPIASDVHSGETNDGVTVVPMLTRLRSLGLSRVVWVADRHSVRVPATTDGR